MRPPPTPPPRLPRKNRSLAFLIAVNRVSLKRRSGLDRRPWTTRVALEGAGNMEVNAVGDAAVADECPLSDECLLSDGCLIGQ